MNRIKFTNMCEAKVSNQRKIEVFTTAPMKIQKYIESKNFSFSLNRSVKYYQWRYDSYNFMF